MIDATKQYVDRAQNHYLILTTAAPGRFPVVAMRQTDGEILRLTINSFLRPCDDTPDGDPVIREVKPRIKRTVWVNVYPSADLADEDAYTGLTTHLSKANADQRAGPYRLACVMLYIEVEQGHGL